MSSAKRAVLTALPWLFLGGCGGSGGSGTPTVPAAVPAAEITSENAPAIAGKVAQSTLEGGGFGSFAGLGSGPGAILAGSGPAFFSTLGGIQKSQTETLSAKARSGGLQAPIPEQTTPCLNSGSVTISGNIASPTTLSAGDTINLVYSMCDDGAGVLDGGYAMRITSFSGDLVSGSFSFGVAVTLADFRVTDGGESVIANGDIAIGLDTSTAPTLTVSLSADSLQVSAGGASGTLTGFSVEETIDEVTFAYMLDASGTLTSSAFTGSVSFETTASLQGTGTGYAFDGQLTITGAGGASITVTVLDGTFVRLEIDLDGDQSADEIVDSTWEELLAQG